MSEGGKVGGNVEGGKVGGNVEGGNVEGGKVGGNVEGGNVEGGKVGGNVEGGNVEGGKVGGNVEGGNVEGGKVGGNVEGGNVEGGKVGGNVEGGKGNVEGGKRNVEGGKVEGGNVAGGKVGGGKGEGGKVEAEVGNVEGGKVEGGKGEGGKAEGEKVEVEVGNVEGGKVEGGKGEGGKAEGEKVEGGKVGGKAEGGKVGGKAEGGKVEVGKVEGGKFEVKVDALESKTKLEGDIPELDSDEESVENYSGSTKDVTSGDKFRYLTDKELEKAKQKRLRKRPQSKAQGRVGDLFEEYGKWKEKCTVHAHVSMEVEYLFNITKDYVRPGGSYRLIRHACVNEGVPVCADYADWHLDPELRYVKGYDIKGYRKRRLQRWCSQVLPIHEDERFDRYLVRCHAEAIKELSLNNQEFETYKDTFPHIVDKWVSVLHLGMLFKRKNMGKTCFIDESELILKLMREECEILYFKTKIMFFEEPNEKRNHSLVAKDHWILHPRNLCGESPI